MEKKGVPTGDGAAYAKYLIQRGAEYQAKRKEDIVKKEQVEAEKDTESGFVPKVMHKSFKKPG